MRILCYTAKGNPQSDKQYSVIHSSRQLHHFTEANRKAFPQLGWQKWHLWHIRGNQEAPSLLFALSGFSTACVVSEGLWDISFCCCSTFGDILQPISCSFRPATATQNQWKSRMAVEKVRHYCTQSVLVDENEIYISSNLFALMPIDGLQPLSIQYQATTNGQLA